MGMETRGVPASTDDEAGRCCSRGAVARERGPRVGSAEGEAGEGGCCWLAVSCVSSGA